MDGSSTFVLSMDTLKSQKIFWNSGTTTSILNINKKENRILYFPWSVVRRIRNPEMTRNS